MIGISILVAVLGTASAGAGLHVFNVARWAAAGIVLGAAVATFRVTPRRQRVATVHALADEPVQ